MKPNSPPSELKLALAEYKPVWRMAAVLTFVVGLLGFTSTVYMLQVYDRVINSRNLMTLASLTVVALGSYAVLELSEKVRTRILWALGIRFELKMSERIYNAMFDGLKGKNGNLAIGAQSDFRTLREFFYNPALSASFELPVAMIALVLIFAINPWMGLAALMGAFAQTAVAALLQSTSREPLLEAQQRAQVAQTYAETSLRNAQVMESMGMVEAVRGHWQKRQDTFLAFQAKASEAAGGLNALSKLLQQLMGSVLMGLGAWFSLSGNLNGGASMMIISSVLVGRMLSPMIQIVQQWSAIVSVVGAWQRLDALLAEVPERPQNMPLPAPKGHLTVENLAASPPGQNFAVLQGLRFDLPPGQVLAVVGPSASGKTSLAKLLMGIWHPIAGKVRLDGVDVHVWDKAELGPYLGYLPQGVELLEGTLAENIARFGKVDMAVVEAAARRVGLHEFILGLPEGYQTPVGRDGGLLSGGQRQRVALARAMYGDPVFVVLDEPNSSLDEAGDAALNQAMASLKAQGTSIVVITHRTSVLAVSDRMLVLRDGAQQLFGSTAEVMQKLRGGPAAQVAGQAPGQTPAAVPAVQGA
jgi:ATP-binding cassette subfamily C exporter for protease/lipase